MVPRAIKRHTKEKSLRDAGPALLLASSGFLLPSFQRDIALDLYAKDITGWANAGIVWMHKSGPAYATAFTHFAQCHGNLC